MKLDEPGILNKVDDMKFSSRNVEIKYQICDSQDYQRIPVGCYIDCPYFEDQQDHENFWAEFRITHYSHGQVILKRNEN
ncbi:MAG: hypothetical protein ACKPFH_16805 [Dolichospermum sp.]